MEHFSLCALANRLGSMQASTIELVSRRYIDSNWLRLSGRVRNDLEFDWVEILGEEVTLKFAIAMLPQVHLKKNENSNAR